jgi:hypothetical protein
MLELISRLVPTLARLFRRRHDLVVENLLLRDRVADLTGLSFALLQGLKVLEQVGATLAEVRKVGDDGFGLYVHEALRSFGVYDGWVGTDPVLRTPIVFCEVHSSGPLPASFLPRAQGAGHEM